LVGYQIPYQINFLGNIGYQIQTESKPNPWWAKKHGIFPNFVKFWGENMKFRGTFENGEIAFKNQKKSDNF